MTDNYDWLFRGSAIGHKMAPNLFVLQPLERGDGTAEGKPSESAYSWYRKLATGHWGILFVENTTCSDNPAERGHLPTGLMMTEHNLPEFRRLVQEIKDVSPETILMIQLSTGSPGNDHEGNKNFMSLTPSVISRLLVNMVNGAVLAAEAGFDGIDIKLCHGHLTFQLLSEANKRQDEWGGENLRQRARFVIEAVQKIREELAHNNKGSFIIGARVSEPNLANLRDIVNVLDKDLHLDFINVSNFPDMFNADAISVLAQAVKAMEPQAAIIQSGFTSYLANHGNPVEKVKLAFQRRLAPDFVGFGRQAIADPLTPEKIKNNRFEEINWCKRCNICFQQKGCKYYS